jgi:predicted amidohydrolase
MKKLHAKRQAIRRPQRLVVPEFNLAVLVVVEIFLPQHLRQIGARRVERLARASRARCAT